MNNNANAEERNIANALISGLANSDGDADS